MLPETITQNARKLLQKLPPEVELLAVCKGHTHVEIEAALAGGIRILGHNYLQEAQYMVPLIKEPVAWHFIGHLQRNKAATAAKMFDLIETLDSIRIAQALDRASGALGKKLSVLIEVNSAEEKNKTGVMPSGLCSLMDQLSCFEHLQVEGLMTMGPYCEDPEKIRPYFRITKELFDELREKALPGIHMRRLSMGMSDSFQVAIQEGATQVRIGTALFGPRGSA